MPQSVFIFNSLLARRRCRVITAIAVAFSGAPSSVAGYLLSSTHARWRNLMTWNVVASPARSELERNDRADR